MIINDITYMSEVYPAAFLRKQEAGFNSRTQLTRLVFLVSCALIEGENMLRVGIVGATGYTGEELISILLKNPKIKITYLAAKVEKKENINKIFPKLLNKINLECDNFNLDKALELCDLLFLALPHTVSMDIVPCLLKNNKIVIDLSADYRLKDVSVYENWYCKVHKDTANLKNAVYGLPELYREKIKKAKLIANPGCYPTAAILAIAPALSTGLIDEASIIIDAKSGASGAGRKASLDLGFCEIDENFKAYKVNQHQHTPEIDQVLSNLADKKIEVTFVPHLVPMFRGILETVYLKTKKRTNLESIIKIYKNFYKKEPFVRILENSLPETKFVSGTNYCDLGFRFDEKKNLLIIISAIDNLIKGASGQAVENMNIICGFKETEALL